MMSDTVIVDGDKVIFIPAFGSAMVVVQPGTITGSGPATVGGKNMCVVGDEGDVEVPGCAYTAPPFVTPGTGTLKIKALAGDQQAKHTSTGNKKVVLKGGQLDAEFQVMSPAMQPQPPPAPPTPDQTKSYTGKGSFQSSNMKFTGT